MLVNNGGRFLSKYFGKDIDESLVDLVPSRDVRVVFLMVRNFQYQDNYDVRLLASVITKIGSI